MAYSRHLRSHTRPIPGENNVHVSLNFLLKVLKKFLLKDLKLKAPIWGGPNGEDWNADQGPGRISTNVSDRSVANDRAPI